MVVSVPVWPCMLDGGTFHVPRTSFLLQNRIGVTQPDLQKSRVATGVYTQRCLHPVQGDNKTCSDAEKYTGESREWAGPNLDNFFSLLLQPLPSRAVENPNDRFATQLNRCVVERLCRHFSSLF